MTMPFTRPDAYVPGLQPPPVLPERSLWFVFRGSELMVAASPLPVALPHCNNPKDLGMMLQRTQYLGVLGDRHCFAAEAAARHEAPPGWNWQGLRALFGGLDDPQFAPARPPCLILALAPPHQF